MDLLAQLTSSNNISIQDVSDNILSLDNERLLAIYDNFNEIVSDIRFILEDASKPVFRAAYSSGKDSSLCLIALLEAYKQSIAENKIEADRLLLITSVDTLIEAIPMAFFLRFSKKHIEAFAKVHNINVIHNLITPPLNSEYFIRWASADKLVTNPTRSSDCTSILKIDTSVKFLARQRKYILKSQPVVTLTGQRMDESNNRAKNMNKQGVKDKAVHNVIDELKSTSNTLNINFAPIRNWLTEDVFDFFRIVGTDPLVQLSQRKPIDTYFTHFALLLELYGKNSNETCSIVVNGDGKTESSGCGGSSERYGCNFCTRIETDKSAISVSVKKYWNYLGTEDALRVRDWLSRLSSSEKARTMHPKAVDPVYNRIMYQPNVLKSALLSKMVKYASQLTVNAEKKSSEFRELIAINKPEEFAGYKAILDDKNIHPKAKQQLLEMYREEASKPYMPYFSLKHAMLLSLRWSLLGVAAAPYHPLKIWDDICQGKSIIPFPKLNSELPKEQWKTKSVPAKEPIVLRFHTEEFEQRFFEDGESFLSYWTKPLGVLDMFDLSNCRKSFNPKGTYPIKAFFTANFAVNAGGLELTVIIDKLKDSKTSRSLNFNDEWTIKNEVESLLKKQVYTYLKEEHGISKAELLENTDVNALDMLADKLNKLVSALKSYTVSVCYINQKQLFSGFKDKATQSTAPIQNTQRVIVNKGNKNGPVIKSTTRCRFYTPTTTPNYALKYNNNLTIAEVDFSTEENESIAMRDYMDELPGDVEPIMFNEMALMDWLDYGGYEKALELHDTWIEQAISGRHYRRSMGLPVGVYRYSSCEPISRLLNEAGMMIEPTYKTIFTKTLKRTHLLHEVGAFELQALPEAQLLACKGTLTMAQHRSDKAGYLLKVRAKRNSKRKELKRLKALSVDNNEQFIIETTSNNMKAIFTQANKYIDSLNLLDHDFNYTENVPVTTQEKAYKTWFDLYGAALSDYNAFKKAFISTNDRKTLANNRFSDLKLSRVFSSLNESVVKKVNDSEYYLPISTIKQQTVESDIISNMSTMDKVSALSALFKVKAAS